MKILTTDLSNEVNGFLDSLGVVGNALRWLAENWLIFATVFVCAVILRIIIGLLK